MHFAPIIQLLLAILAVQAGSVFAQSPHQCFQTSRSLVELVKCLQQFFLCGSVQNDYVEPDSEQVRGLTAIVPRLLSIKKGSECARIALPPSLSFYSIAEFRDKFNGVPYCVLYEHVTLHGQFVQAFGLLVVSPTANAKLPRLHFSATHPFTDGPVDLEASVLFRDTFGKSLLIATACRNASRNVSDCQRRYFKSDAAHNSASGFHIMAKEIWKWQLRQPNGCPTHACSFIQLHGKANTSCSDSEIFFSAGSANTSYYKSQDLPVVKLQRAFGKTAPQWHTSNPLTYKNCTLKALDNVLGRLVNGVPEGMECNISADSMGRFTGKFVHAEQAYESRNKGNKAWTGAIRLSFKEGTPRSSGPILRTVYNEILILPSIVFLYHQLQNFMW